jgi:diacylglycerol kinase family enzyme
VRAPTVLARLRTLIALARGSWRDLDGIETIEATRAVLRRHDRHGRHGRRSGRIAMDGELVRLRYPFEFRMAPKAVRLVAAPSASPREAS